MTQANFPEITDAEWELMRILWAKPGLTSREIINTAMSFLDWKEGTIKSLLNRLTQKGLVMQDTKTRPYTYLPLQGQMQANKKMFLKQLNRVCTKKRHQILETLIEETELSQSNCQALIDLLITKKENSPKQVAFQFHPGQCDCHINEKEYNHENTNS